jgi:hypothetical protein
MELPIYELTLEQLEQGIDAIALVEQPAIQRNWMAFNKDKEYKFATHNEEKRILAGALIVADYPMYRNMKGKEFYVKFSAQTIEQLADRLVLKDKLRSFNIEHDSNKTIPDLHIQQFFIIDTEKGINTPLGMETLPNGSLFAFVKVNNEEIWADYCKTGLVKGFSIEGNFEIDLALNDHENEEIKKLKQENMKLKEKWEQFLAKFDETPQSTESVAQAASTAQVFEQATTMEGVIVEWQGELAEGVAVTLEDGTPAPDGEHTFEDGSVISLVDGKVVAIVKPMSEQEMKIKELEDEKTKLKSEIDSLKAEFEKSKLEIETKFKADLEKQKEINLELKSMVENHIIEESKHDFKEEKQNAAKSHIEVMQERIALTRKSKN